MGKREKNEAHVRSVQSSGDIQSSSTFSGGVPFANALTIDYYSNIFVPGLTQPDAITVAPGPCPAPYDGANCPPQYLNPPSYSTTATVPKLDQTTGTPGTIYELTSVLFEYTWYSAATPTVINIGTQEYAFTNAHAVVPITVTGPNGTAASATAQAGNCAGTAIPFILYIGCPTGYNEGTANNTALTGLNYYQGFGASNVEFDVLVDGATFGGSSSAFANTLFFGGGAGIGIALHVRYNYVVRQSSAPEPMTMMMVGSAIVGLGLLMRRRNKTKS